MRSDACAALQEQACTSSWPRDDSVWLASATTWIERVGCKLRGGGHLQRVGVAGKRGGRIIEAPGDAAVVGRAWLPVRRPTDEAALW